MKMPDRYMSIITDGMDSSKTNIPHFKVKSKVSLSEHVQRRRRHSDKTEGGHLNCMQSACTITSKLHGYRRE